MKKIALNLLKIIISAGLIIYILFFQVDLDEVWAVIVSANFGPLLLGAALMIGGVALRAVRWQVLLQGLKIHVPLPRLVYFYFMGSFFNLFLPTGMGGDAVKMAKLAQETGQVPESIGITLVERATGLWVLFILALLALPFSSDLLPAGWMPLITTITLAGVIGGFVVMWTPLVPWLGSKVRLPGQASLERFYRSVSQLGWRALGQASLISLVFDLLLIWLVQLIAVSLGVNLPWIVFFLFTPLISFSLTLPISIGGLGVREQTYILLFQTMNVSAEAATAMSLLFYILSSVLIGLIGGVLYMIASLRSTRAAGNQI
jgi:uncharacterized membrane protein YbhN (UPF0104 family)